jgi:hypothetical protein
MIEVREAVADDASAIAALLGELGYPVSAAAWGCETLELTSRDDRPRTHRFYAGPGFEPGSRKFARPVAG